MFIVTLYIYAIGKPISDQLRLPAHRGREISVRISWILIREGTLEKHASISLEGTQNSNGIIPELCINNSDGITILKDKDNL
jgi:hypothetical protein